MKHNKPNITPEQRRNLVVLAAHLLKVPQRTFDMSMFQLVLDCGTVGCAVGHGPSAGIPREINGSRTFVGEKLSTLANVESWLTYSERVFGAYRTSDLYQFCFSCGWSEHDNSPEGAAYRICYALTRGTPEVWYFRAVTTDENWRDQTEWREPFVITPAL